MRSIDIEVALRMLNLPARAYLRSDGSLLSRDEIEAETRAKVEAEFAERRLEAARKRGRAAARRESLPLADSAARSIRPVQRQAAHAAAILQALRDAGFNARELPETPKGKVSPAKSAARRALTSMSSAVFDKAWQALRTQGRISDRAV